MVDDDLLALRYVRDALTKAGYTPIVTGDPQEALALMYEMKPQLALLDLMLPGMDGIELKKEILEIGAVPVIFLSAYGQDHIIARAIDIRGGRLRRQTMLADRVDGPVQVVHWQPSVTPGKRPRLH